jgi:hypothetical protein
LVTCGPGVVVFIPGRAFNVIVGADGVFQMDTVPPGTYEVHFEHNGVLLQALQAVVTDTVVDLGSISLVDPLNDAANCGACGNVCAPTQSCVQGQCSGAVCGAGQSMCGTTCLDLSTDVNNCGQCGRACGGGSQCVNGSCLAPPQCSTPSDCPGSDTVCASRTCVQGVCGFTFATAGTPGPNQVAGDCKQTVCDGSGNLITQNADFDLPDDGNQCTNDLCSNGNPVHQFALFGTACSQNGGNFCDGSGACINTLTDVNNCGVIGNHCTVANGTPVCVNGQCSVNTCNSGFGNCNGLVMDGCEINVLNSANNCGACGLACNAGQVCVNGQCSGADFSAGAPAQIPSGRR